MIVHAVPSLLRWTLKASSSSELSTHDNSLTRQSVLVAVRLEGAAGGAEGAGVAVGDGEAVGVAVAVGVGVGVGVGGGGVAVGDGLGLEATTL
jgi:hypothetical protein